MNVNRERFAYAPPTVEKERSSFDMPFRVLATENFGYLHPFYVLECLPGDTFTVSTQVLSRMSTLLYPVMDNAFIDFAYFFVPCRLVWERWAEFLGENKLSAWAQEVEYILPHGVVTPKLGDVFDAMGVPVYDQASIDRDEYYGISEPPSFDLMILPARAYHLIYNEWYRNQNTTDPILVNTGDDVDADEIARYGSLCKVTKFPDVFTKSLPAPQKGDAVDIPIASGALPVFQGAKQSGVSFAANWQPLQYQVGNGTDTYDHATNTVNVFGQRQAPANAEVANLKGTGSVALYNLPSGQAETQPLSGGLYLTNLYADASSLDSVTINMLRQAFQMQRLLELQARSGSRYTEIILASFGVHSPDARLQRPEYLGGNRARVQVQQVTQTTPVFREVEGESVADSPLGRLGASSKTAYRNEDFTYSCQEHGFIIGVFCARTTHTYQQGLDRMWSRRGRYDIYWPTFAHIGEQPIYREQLYATGVESEDKTVFGYQEAWAEYRYKPNRVTGHFRSTVNENLDEWHFADLYTSPPLLSAGFVEETAVNVDRTLAVTSAVHDQLLLDIQVNCKASRVMPLYSVPGLLDHF